MVGYAEFPLPLTSVRRMSFMVSYDVYGWHLWVSFFYFPLTLFPLSYFWRGAV